MIDTQFQQELLEMEILLNEFKINYIRNGTIFSLPGCKLVYLGPALHWRVRNERFKLSSMRKYYIMHYLKLYCDAYQRYLLLRQIPEILFDTATYEIIPRYLLL